MNTYQLFFGRTIHNQDIDEYVTDQAWEAFEECLSIAFDGYTIQDAKGAWKGIQEDCKVVTIMSNYPAKIRDICNAYRRVFKQDAIGLLVSEPMKFVSKEIEVF